MGPNLSGVATLAMIGIIAIFGAIGLGIYSFCDYVFLDDKYETKKLIVPEMVVKSELKFGKTTSDTTYIYTFN